MPLPMMPTKQWELVRMMPPEVLDAAAQGKYLNQGISPVFALARIEEEGALKAAFQAEEQKRMQEEQAKMQGLPPGSPILDQRLSARGVDSSGITGADPSAGQEVPPDRMEQLQGGIAGGPPQGGPSPQGMPPGGMPPGPPGMMAAGGLIPRYQAGNLVQEDPRRRNYVLDPITLEERVEEAARKRREREEARQRRLNERYPSLETTIDMALDPGRIEARQSGDTLSEEDWRRIQEAQDAQDQEDRRDATIEAGLIHPEAPPGLGSENFPPGLQEAIDAGAIHPGVTSVGEGPPPPQEVVDLSDILPESAFAGDMLQQYHQAALDRRERAGEYSEEEQYRDYLREEELKDQLMDVRREGELWEGQREGRQATQAEYDRLAGERETLAGESTTALENTLAEAYGYGRTQEEELRRNQARTEELRGRTTGQLEDLYAKQQATGKSQISDLQRAADFSADAALFTGMGDQFVSSVRPQFGEVVSDVGDIRKDAMTAVHEIQTGMLDDEKDYVNKLFEVDTDILTGARNTATGVRQIQNNLIDKRVTTDEGIRTIAENLLRDAGTDITNKRKIQDAIDTGDTAALRNLVVAEAGVRGFALTMQEERIGRIEDPDIGYMQDMRPILPTWMQSQASIEASRVAGLDAARATERITLRNTLMNPEIVTELERLNNESITAINSERALDKETGELYTDDADGEWARDRDRAAQQQGFQKQLQEIMKLMSYYAEILNTNKPLDIIESVIDRDIGAGTARMWNDMGPDELRQKVAETEQALRAMQEKLGESGG